jgi:hypothetical protein
MKFGGFNEKRKKQAKKMLQEKSLPYAAWTGNLTIPIAIIFIFILALAGYQKSFLAIVILIATIQIHRTNAKLKLGGLSYLAPIMVYVYQALSIPMAILLFNLNAVTIFVLIGVEILFYAAVIIAIVFFFITASKVKKQFPTMKADRQAALTAYKDKINNMT